MRTVIIVLNVLLNWSRANRYSSWLHQGLHVAHNVVLSRPQIPKLAVNDAAMDGNPHPFRDSLLGVDDEGTGPELHVV